jgi:hypothetical protein
MWPIIVFALLGAVAGGQPPASFDSSKAVLSAPKTIAEIDAGKLKGELVRLAWGDEGRFFLRSAEMDRFQNELGKNFVIAPGGALTQVTEEPAWAALYWVWKAGFAAPGAPDFRFDVETREQNKTATGSTGQDFGGAGGGTANPNRSDPSANQIAKDLGSMQKVVTTTVRLKGELIVEVQNRRLVPGATFSWAPAPYAALAFVNSRKRLVILDRQGRKLEVPGTSDVYLPAWSPDGLKVAYLEKRDKRKYALMEVEVGK